MQGVLSRRLGVSSQYVHYETNFEQQSQTEVIIFLNNRVQWLYCVRLLTFRNKENKATRSLRVANNFVPNHVSV